MIISDNLESTNEALEKMSKDHSGFRDRISKIRKEVWRLCAKALRTPGQRAHAVEAAISKATNDFEAQAERPDGRIENWVRDLSCKPIAIQHLPASQTPGAISDMRAAEQIKCDSVRLLLVRVLDLNEGRPYSRPKQLIPLQIRSGMKRTTAPAEGNKGGNAN